MPLLRLCRLPLIILALCLAAMPLPILSAADDAKPAATDAKADAKKDLPSAILQERAIAMMKEMEEKFINIARELEKTEPEQAKRLIAALNKAKAEGLKKRMETVIDLVNDKKFDTAAAEQKEILNRLREMLEILTQDPDDLDAKLKEIKELERIKAEVEKIIRDETGQLKDSQKAADPNAAVKDLEKQIAAVGKLIEKQEGVIKSTGAAKEQGVHQLGKVAKEQRDVRQETEKVNKDIAGGDQAGDQSGKPGDQSGKPGDQSGKPGDQSGKPGDQSGKPGDQSGKPGDQSGKPSGEGPSGPSDQPGQKPLAKAIDSQKAAEQDLGDGKGKAAEKNEKEALDHLKQALDELKKERDRIAKLPPEHFDELAKKQDKTADQTGDLAKKMKEMKSSGGGQGGQGGQGGESGDSEGSEGAPGQEQVQQAQQSMQQASKKLGNKDPKDAGKDQKDSIDKLKQAREEIEKRLAQLRKDMQEQLLAALEARFREMLEKQKPLTIETVSLDGIKMQRKWNRTEQLTVANLGKEEKFIGDLADVALQIIKEDGTTVVFPRIVERLRDDLVAVSERLKSEQTDGFTQDMQKEIERTLQDLIEALQRAQQVAEQQKGESGQGGGQQPNPPLVPESAELKLIKQAQMRVNRLTNSIDKNLQAAAAAPGNGPNANDRKAVRDIARRQEEVQKMAEDIVERK